MTKNVTLLALLITIVSGGIAYAIYSAPDLPPTKLFSDTLNAFGKQSSSLEERFAQSGSLDGLPASSLTSISFDFEAPKLGVFKVNIKASIANDQITLHYSENLPILGGESIILQPYNKDGKVRWKCIDGSVLVRYRTKNCRLGYGFLPARP